MDTFFSVHFNWQCSVLRSVWSHTEHNSTMPMCMLHIFGNADITNTNDPYSHISAHLSLGPVWTRAQGSMETLISRDNEQRSHLCGRLALMWHTVHRGEGECENGLLLGARPTVFVWTAYQPQHSAIKTSLFLKTTMSNFLWIGFIGFTIWWEVDHSPDQRKYSQYILPKRSLKI